MKRAYLGVVLGLFFACLGTPSAHAASLFSRDLHIGDTGPDVLALQKVLNESTSTEIAMSGPGSPGHETDYFGALTKSAVIRYQNKYAAIILEPLGLSKGTGFVGFSTRAMLIAQSAGPVAVNTSLPTRDTTPAATTTPTSPALPASPVALTPSTQTPVTPINPNEAHLSSFITTLRALGAKQGLPATTTEAVIAAIQQEAATSTNLTQKFLSKLPRTNTMTLSLGDSSIGHQILALATHALTTLGFVSTAQAASGVPFGGAILGAYPCSCAPGIWLINVADVGPSHATALSYTSGSEAFAYYNLPAATWVLGNYEPGVPACWFVIPFSCAPSPQAGLISPMVGSSGA